MLMRNHDEGGKMLPLHNVMLFEADCVLENAVQVKQKQSTANGCRVLLWLNRAFSRGFACCGGRPSSAYPVADTSTMDEVLDKETNAPDAELEESR